MVQARGWPNDDTMTCEGWWPCHAWCEERAGSEEYLLFGDVGSAGAGCVVARVSGVGVGLVGGEVGSAPTVLTERHIDR